MSQVSPLVVNGDFATGDFTGWTVTNLDSDLHVELCYGHSGLFGCVGHGRNYVFLTQSITTVPGQIYHISFQLLNTAVRGNNQFCTLWDSSAIPELTHCDVDAFPFRLFQAPVRATRNETTIGFALCNPTGYWVLDSIAVVETGSSVRKATDTVIPYLTFADSGKHNQSPVLAREP